MLIYKLTSQPMLLLSNKYTHNPLLVIILKLNQQENQNKMFAIAVTMHIHCVNTASLPSSALRVVLVSQFSK